MSVDTKIKFFKKEKILVDQYTGATLSNQAGLMQKMSLYFSGFETQAELDAAYDEGDDFLETVEGKKMLSRSRDYVIGQTLEEMFYNIRRDLKLN